MVIQPEGLRTRIDSRAIVNGEEADNLIGISKEKTKTPRRGERLNGVKGERGENHSTPGFSETLEEQLKEVRCRKEAAGRELFAS